jgi:hypothetical protein
MRATPYQNVIDCSTLVVKTAMVGLGVPDVYLRAAREHVQEKDTNGSICNVANLAVLVQVDCMPHRPQRNSPKALLLDRRRHVA